MPYKILGPKCTQRCRIDANMKQIVRKPLETGPGPGRGRAGAGAGPGPGPGRGPSRVGAGPRSGRDVRNRPRTGPAPVRDRSGTGSGPVLHRCGTAPALVRDRSGTDTFRKPERLPMRRVALRSSGGDRPPKIFIQAPLCARILVLLNRDNMSEVFGSAHIEDGLQYEQTRT